MRAKQTKSRPPFEAGKLVSNAVNSISLGIEDFNLSRAESGNSLRALSAARNFYSGLLLLFKFRIAITTHDVEKSEGLVYEADKILPFVNENGDIEWRPVGLKKTTIDYAAIKSRFESLGIKTDWNAVKSLQECRNDLEHFSSSHSMADIGRFVANLFPLLHRFIADELKWAPAELLGSAWASMIEFHEFYSATQERAKFQWESVGLPIAASSLLQECRCSECNSRLLAPNRADIEFKVPIDTSDFRYECVECHNSESLSELLEAELSLIQDPDPFVEESNIVECDSCFFVLFSLIDECCHWCGYTRKVPRCEHCCSYLSELEAHHGCTICDRCNENNYLHYLENKMEHE
nr:hypothetical protein [uncultured Pseudomonas sp.]